MYCPSCGLEDIQANQFCRSCGSDLRPVRNALTRPDQITESAAVARDEIGRAVAAKILETRTAAELSTVAEEVLPELEKFLESPEEKRLRRMRVGTLLSAIGLGTAVGISIVSRVTAEPDVIILAAFGLVCFFLGLGFVLNGILLTVPRRSLPGSSSAAAGQRELDTELGRSPALQPAAARDEFTSVVEQTTRNLKDVR
ncbi:MAG: hypothetical protein AB7Q37_02125 [Pyrinomonadaceae bacterium]